MTERKLPGIIEGALNYINPERQAENRIQTEKLLSEYAITMIERTPPEHKVETAVDFLGTCVNRAIWAFKSGQTEETVEKMFSEFSSPIVELLVNPQKVGDSSDELDIPVTIIPPSAEE